MYLFGVRGVFLRGMGYGVWGLGYGVRSKGSIFLGYGVYLVSLAVCLPFSNKKSKQSIRTILCIPCIPSFGAYPFLAVGKKQKKGYVSLRRDTYPFFVPASEKIRDTKCKRRDTTCILRRDKYFAPIPYPLEGTRDFFFSKEVSVPSFTKCTFEKSLFFYAQEKIKRDHISFQERIC